MLLKPSLLLPQVLAKDTSVSCYHQPESQSKDQQDRALPSPPQEKLYEDTLF